MVDWKECFVNLGECCFKPFNSGVECRFDKGLVVWIGGNHVKWEKEKFVGVEYFKVVIEDVSKDEKKTLDNFVGRLGEDRGLSVRGYDILFLKDDLGGWDVHIMVRTEIGLYESLVEIKVRSVNVKWDGDEFVVECE